MLASGRAVGHVYGTGQWAAVVSCLKRQRPVQEAPVESCRSEPTHRRGLGSRRRFAPAMFCCYPVRLELVCLRCSDDCVFTLEYNLDTFAARRSHIFNFVKDRSFVLRAIGLIGYYAAPFGRSGFALPLGFHLTTSANFLNLTRVGLVRGTRPT